MRSLIPAPGLSLFRREVDRLFDRFWEDDGELASVREWMPSLDFSEGADAFTVKVEIPGLEPQDVHVTLQDNVLTVKGEKKQETKKEDERFYRMERVHGVFSRSLRLPSAVDGAKVNATFKNGVLTIVVPKAPEARSATIPIKVG